MTPTAKPLETAIDEIASTAQEDKVQVGTLLDTFEDRSLGFILTIVALLVSLPVIGAIPGLPNVAALVVLFTVGHSLIGGQQRFWAPTMLRQKSIDGGTVRAVLDRVRPYGKWVDRRLDNRLAWIVDSAPARVAISLVVALLAVAMVVLSFVPFAMLPASLAILIFGLALMARDGALAMLGYVFTIGTGVALWQVWAAVM